MLAVVDGDGDLENSVEKLEGREDDIVDILDVVKAEDLLECGELLGGDVIAVLEDVVSLLLRLLLGLEGHNGKNDGISVKQKSQGGENDRDHSVLIKKEEVDHRADDDQRDECEGAEGYDRHQAHALYHIGIAFLIEDGKRCLLRADTDGGQARFVADQSAKSYLFEIVAVAVSEQKRSGALDLDVLKSVVVEDLSCDIDARESEAVFKAIVAEVFYRQP